MEATISTTTGIVVLTLDAEEAAQLVERLDIEEFIGDDDILIQLRRELHAAEERIG